MKKKESKILRFDELINESKHDFGFLMYGNFDSKPLPKTDDELEYDRNLSMKAISSFDELFGTNIREMYGDDFSMLLQDPSINHPTSGDVIKKLVEISYQPKWYSKFEIKNNSENINGMILDQLINNYQGKEISWKHIIEYLKQGGVKSAQRKQEFIYKLFLYFGSEFNQEIVKKAFEIKNKKHVYDVDDTRTQSEMEQNIELAWWKCLKWSMDHYKDYFKLEEVIIKALNKLITLLKEKTNLIEKWVDYKIKLFLNNLK